jgi:hypothetical protein
MKKLVISAAVMLASLTMSAQDIYQFPNVSKKPKTFKIEKVTPTAQQSQDSLSATAQQSQDSFSATRHALTLQELTTVNPTIPLHAGAAYLRKSAHLDNLALGCAGAAAASALAGALMDDTDSQKPFWYISGLFALSGLASEIVSINYRLRASQLFSSVTITPTTVKLTF